MQYPMMNPQMYQQPYQYPSIMGGMGQYQQPQQPTIIMMGQNPYPQGMGGYQPYGGMGGGYGMNTGFMGTAGGYNPQMQIQPVTPGSFGAQNMSYNFGGAPLTSSYQMQF